MDQTAVEQAARVVADLRVGAARTPIEELPEACRPRSLDEAYELQEAARAVLLARRFGPAVGWKVGCTTPVMQAYLGIDHPCAGTLYAPRVFRQRATFDHGSYFRLGLECEIAVRLAEDVVPRAGGHDATSVVDAVGAVMASIEVVEHRFLDFEAASTASLIADDFFSVGCVLGPEVAPSEVGDLAMLEGGFTLDGVAAEERGRGGAILGHPLNALAWLANHLEGRGARLRAGEVVTLGSVVQTVYPASGVTVVAAFEGLGEVVVEVG